MRIRRSIVLTLLIGLVVGVMLLGAIVMLGSQVSARLGGPCSFPEQGPLPSFCFE